MELELPNYQNADERAGDLCELLGGLDIAVEHGHQEQDQEHCDATKDATKEGTEAKANKNGEEYSNS